MSKWEEWPPLRAPAGQSSSSSLGAGEILLQLDAWLWPPSPLTLAQKSSWFSEVPWIWCRAREFLPVGPGCLCQKLRRHSKPINSVWPPKLAPCLDLILHKDLQFTEYWKHFIVFPCLSLWTWNRFHAKGNNFSGCLPSQCRVSKTGMSWLARAKGLPTLTSYPQVFLLKGLHSCLILRILFITLPPRCSPAATGNGWDGSYAVSPATSDMTELKMMSSPRSFN